MTKDEATDREKKERTRKERARAREREKKKKKRETAREKRAMKRGSNLRGVGLLFRRIC